MAASCLSRLFFSSSTRTSLSVYKSKQFLPPSFSALNQFSSTASGNDNEKTTADLPDILVSPSQQASSSVSRAQKIVKAMKVYLEKVVEYRDFMKVQAEEYEIGRKHLARMMGCDPQNFGREEIDEAIKYLLPSAIYDKKARPLMRNPEEIFPRPKAAEFDYSGRPTNTFFYTGKANYYQLLFDMTEKMHALNAFQDEMYRKGIYEASPESKIDLIGSDWVTYNVFQEMMQEKIRENEYALFIDSIVKLCNHPYSNREKEFVMKYRRAVFQTTSKMIIPELKYEGGRPYMDAEGKRKSARAWVRVWGNGTGKISINGEDILYFKAIQDREQVMFPLQLTNLLGRVDVEATVTGGGPSGQSGAIRHGISQALASFVTRDCVERMRLAGLLTIDRRTLERKKPGQKGARAKYTWKKR